MPIFARNRIQLKEDATEKALLPSVTKVEEDDSSKSHSSRTETTQRALRRRLALLLILLPSLYVISHSTSSLSINNIPYFPRPVEPAVPTTLPPHVQHGLQACAVLDTPRPDLSSFSINRTESHRFEPGTKPVLLRNGTLWTGGEDGNEIISGGSIFLDRGIIKEVGKHEDVQAFASRYGKGLKGSYETVELDGKWVTPGLVDPHSHIGVDMAPGGIVGSQDTNSVLAPTQPYLRTIDAINPHDAAMPLTVSGGVTTALILHGSAVPMGAESFLIKLRPTKEYTPESMMVEPGWETVEGVQGGEVYQRTKTPRYLKQATGENPNRVLHATRQNTGFLLREAYEKGLLLKTKQEMWCAKGKENTEPYPTNEWDTLAEVIRGNVVVMTHTYEEPDIGMLARLTNEFKFKIAGLHHFHEGYLVIDTLRKFWGGTPTACIFATNARYKREAWWGSEYAPYILNEANVSVSFKSDHPVLDSRFLIHEASQGLSYGLPFNKALAAVTTVPAATLSMGHRIGSLKSGFDADVTVWDSVPLAIGATPVQVYIDGIPQLESPFLLSKPELQEPLSAPDVKKAAAKVLKYHGEPPLEAASKASNVVFTSVQALYLKNAQGLAIEEVQLAAAGSSLQEQKVVVHNGQIACSGSDCAIAQDVDFEYIDLKGGSITAGLTTYGSNVGLMEIRQESSTTDGIIDDVLTDSADLLDGLIVKGSDGARFGGRDELIAYASGVTTGVAHPLSKGTFGGLSYSFSTGGETPLDGVKQDVAAMHVTLGIRSKFSTSTNIAILRDLLAGTTGQHTPFTKTFKRIAAGEIPLVITAHKADIIAAIIKLKGEAANADAKFVIEGATESHMVAAALAKAKIGVIVSPIRSYPHDWDQRRIMAGLPWTELTLPAYLSSKGVTVALGITEEWMARNTKFEAAWQLTQGPQSFSKASALDLVSTNLEKLLGVKAAKSADASWVAWEGDWTSMHAKAVAVRGEGQAHVDLFA